MTIEQMDNVVSSQVARQVLDYWFTEYAAGDLAKKQDKRWFSGGSLLIRRLGNGLVIVLNLRSRVDSRTGKASQRVVWL